MPKKRHVMKKQVEKKEKVTQPGKPREVEEKEGEKEEEAKFVNRVAGMKRVRPAPAAPSDHKGSSAHSEGKVTRPKSKGDGGKGSGKDKSKTKDAKKGKDPSERGKSDGGGAAAHGEEGVEGRRKSQVERNQAKEQAKLKQAKKAKTAKAKPEPKGGATKKEKELGKRKSRPEDSPYNFDRFLEPVFNLWHRGAQRSDLAVGDVGRDVGDAGGKLKASEDSQPTPPRKLKRGRNASPVCV